MDKTFADLIIHPVRMRIMQLLLLNPLTTQQISDALPDVPTSSIYRHLKMLLDHEVIAVSETRQVRGVEEKTYTLAQAPRISDPNALQDLSADEHIHYFTMFAMSLIQSFAEYIRYSPNPNMMDDRVGYTEAMFYASDEDIERIGETLSTMLSEIGHNSPDGGRRLRKLAFITHPLINPIQDDDPAEAN